MTRIVLGIQLYNLYCKKRYNKHIKLFIIIRYSVTSLLDSLYFAATSEQVEDLILRCTPPPSSLATQDSGEQFVSHKKIRQIGRSILGRPMNFESYSHISKCFLCLFS